MEILSFIWSTRSKNKGKSKDLSDFHIPLQPNGDDEMTRTEHSPKLQLLWAVVVKLYQMCCKKRTVSDRQEGHGYPKLVVVVVV